MTTRTGTGRMRNQGLTCKVDGCDRDAACRGWCQKHYGRWLAYGDPVKSGLPRLSMNASPVTPRVRRRRMNAPWWDEAENTKQEMKVWEFGE